MAVFEVQGPDGAVYEIDAPDEATAAKAFQSFSAPSQKQQPQSSTWYDVLEGMTPVGLAKTAYRGANQLMTDPMAALRSVDDAARTAANGVTLGFADKIAAKGNHLLGVSDGYDVGAEREKSEAAKDRLGAKGDALEIASMAVPSTAALKVGMTFSKIPKVGKYVGGILDGSAFGGIDAIGHDTDVKTGMGIGLLGGAAGDAVASIVGKAANKIKGGGKASIPDIEDLQKAKTAAYRAVDDAGGTYGADSINDLIGGMSDELQAAKISKMRHPRASSMLEDIQSMAGKDLSFTELDQLRQTISRDVASSNDAAERFFGQKMIANIDEFEMSQGNSLTKNARDANSKFRKFDRVTNAAEKADLRAASTGSGGNVDNAIRQNIRAILASPKLSRGFTEAELAALEKVVRGGKGQNALRLAGKMAPQGNGLMAALGVGGAMVNPVLGIPSLLGGAAKMSADRMTKSNLDDALRLIGNGDASSIDVLPEALRRKIARAVGVSATGGLLSLQD